MEFNHTLILKFKDGKQYPTPRSTSFTNSGVDFLTSIATCVKNNSPITLTDETGGTIIRKFSDLHSIEIVIG